MAFVNEKEGLPPAKWRTSDRERDLELVCVKSWMIEDVVENFQIYGTKGAIYFETTYVTHPLEDKDKPVLERQIKFWRVAEGAEYSKEEAYRDSVLNII